MRPAAARANSLRSIAVLALVAVVVGSQPVLGNEPASAPSLLEEDLSVPAAAPRPSAAAWNGFEHGEPGKLLRSRVSGGARDVAFDRTVTRKGTEMVFSRRGEAHGDLGLYIESRGPRAFVEWNGAVGRRREVWGQSYFTLHKLPRRRLGLVQLGTRTQALVNITVSRRGVVRLMRRGQILRTMDRRVRADKTYRVVFHARSGHNSEVVVRLFKRDADRPLDRIRVKDVRFRRSFVRYRFGQVVGHRRTPKKEGSTVALTLDDIEVNARRSPKKPQPDKGPNPNPEPTPEPTPEPIPGPTTSPPSTVRCSGTDVSPGDDLASIVNGGVSGQTFCIHAGTYDIGARTLNPKPNQRFIGDPVTVGPKGEISAPTKIKGRSLDGVIYFSRPADGVVIENLDVSGATGMKDKTDPTTKKHGRGLNGNSVEPVITIRYSRFHHNSNAGVGGIGPGTLLDHVELDNNGSDSYLGCCAGGVKSGNYYEIRNSYVHDNTGYGIWCDVGCEGGVWRIHQNLVENNSVDGIRYEISMNPFGALIENNVVRGNNIQGEIGGHGGIAIVSSWNATVRNNALGGNRHAGVEIKDDQRGTIYDVAVKGNTLNGDVLKGCDVLGAVCG